MLLLEAPQLLWIIFVLYSASVRENVCNNSEKHKKSCLFGFRKKRKNAGHLITQHLLNYRKSVLVSHGHQHQTSCSGVWTQETIQLRAAPIISGSFEAKISTDIQQTYTFCDFLRLFATSFQKNVNSYVFGNLKKT